MWSTCFSLPMRLYLSLSLWALCLGLFVDLGYAQSSMSGASRSTSTTSSTASSSSFTLSVVNATATVVRPLSSRTRALTRSTTFVTTFSSTETIYLTPSTTSTIASSTLSASPSATTTAIPSIHLETKVDGAFAVLGVLLVLTGLPTAFLGHKNRWSSFFLLGFYSFSAVCAVIILKFGVLDREQQELSLPNAKLRGLYLLACAVAGFVGGGVAIFFWQMTKYLIGALGGLAFALWIQCMRHSGLVRPIGYRWLMYIGCAVIGFTLCTVPRLHYPVLLAATAMVGASAFMLGVDCFSTAGLKEFYIWNLGFHKMFPKFEKIGFGVSQTIAIELGLIAAVALAGAAVQMRVLNMLRVRLHELTEEHRRRDAELEIQAADRFRDVEAAREEWEKKHGHGGGSESISAAPLLYGGVGGESPSEAPGTPATSAGVGARPVSSLFNFPTTGTRSPIQPSDRPPQSPGALPALDLGNTVKDEIPADMIDRPTMIDDHPEIRERQQLVSEIREIRKSLDALSMESRNERTGRNSSFGDVGKAVAADATKRATVAAASTTAGTSTARNNGLSVARDRVRSMIAMPTPRPISSVLGSSSTATPAARPTSVPLPDDDWETYVQERKLFQPPSGVTAPIPTSDIPETLSLSRQASTRVAPSEAVLAALAQRQRRESLFDPTLSTPLESIPDEGGLGSGSGGAGARQSWISVHENETGVRSPTPPAFVSPPVPSHHRRSSSIPGLTRAPSTSSGAVLQSQSQSQSQSPITILPPARNPRSPTAQQPASPSSPTERVLTYEEYNERHRARLHALQKPLTKQETKEATLAEARARWERSKEVESKVMTRKHAEEVAEVEARLRAKNEAERDRQRRTQSKSPVPDQARGAGPSSPTSPDRRTSRRDSSEHRPEHRRNSLSLDKLGSSSRMSPTLKVDEWRKYQAAVAPEEASKRASTSGDGTSRYGHVSSRRDT